MKAVKFTFIAIIVSLITVSLNAQNQGVAINSDGSQADPSAMLDVKSTTGGILIPRMTETQRTNISSPATGLMVFQTDGTSGFYYYDGAWKYIGGPDSDWNVSGNDIYNLNSGNVGIGTNSPGAKLDVAGHIWQTGTGNSVFLGEEAGQNDDLSGNANVFVGTQAGKANSTGDNNVGVGAQALLSNTTGSKNISIGAQSSWFNTSGSSNVSIGYWASANNASGSFNTILGTTAFKMFTGSSYNTALGYNCLGDLDIFHLTNYTGDRLTAVGYEALFKNQSGSRNTGVGYKALYSNKDGEHNTALGHGASENMDGLNNTTALGYAASPDKSNQVVLGDSQVIQVKTAGGITIGNTTVTEAGTIKFENGHFWGYDGTNWKQLDN